MARAGKPRVRAADAYCRIALVIGADGEYSRRVLRGISQFVRETGVRWLFFLTPHRAPDWKLLSDWSPAGVIAHLIDQRDAQRLAARRKPLVNVAFRFERPRPTHVGNDDRAIAQAAAEHLLERRFRNFAFAGQPGLRFSDLRQQGFEEAVVQAGGTFQAFTVPPGEFPVRGSGSRARYERLRAWLGTLETPVGVMAANDVLGREVLEACRELGRRVPEEIAVVGADNDEAWCLLAHPPLSSVASAAERIGYLAAERLERLLAGRSVPAHTAVAPLGVVVRQSSDTLAVADPLVAQALEFIRQNADRPIGIPDVLAAAPASRRALERAFQKSLGRTPAAEIRAAHLRRAQELLAETDLSLAEIARQSGLAEQKQLSVLFRRLRGVTPSEYRRQRRLPGR